MVTPLARRRPAKVARETATLDRLSDGRLTLGVGLGSDRFAREYSITDPLGRAGDRGQRDLRIGHVDDGLAPAHLVQTKAPSHPASSASAHSRATSAGWASSSKGGM